MLRDNIVYFKEFVSEFKNVGSICPSSKWASKALAAPVRTIPGPKRILEIGAGTGSVTKYLLRYMGEQDELGICEISSRFMHELKIKLLENPDYVRHQKRISFFECPVQDMPEEKPFDIMVCALPFLNFDIETLDEIFSKFMHLGHNGTIMTYFEYIGLRKLGKVLNLDREKQRVKEVEAYLYGRCMPRRIGQRTIWLNVLPINVYTLNMAA